MRYVGRFGKFWYDFVVGDDWRVAVAVVAAVVLVTVAADAGHHLWWFLPLAVTAALGRSLVRATRRPHD